MTQTAATHSLGQMLRGTLAVLAGVADIMALSLATDQVFYALGVYPP